MLLYQTKKVPVISNEICEMLGDINISIDRYTELSDSQRKAFEMFKNGKNLLILGAGGVGKSMIIETFKNYNNGKNKIMYTTATTGISAYSIGGMTIHSFMGIGTGDLEFEVLLRKVYRKQMYRERIIQTDILVVDEISMLSADLFEKLNKICQFIRKNKKFFGGIQVVFTGDFNQLLPVFTGTLNGSIQDTRLIVQSQDFNNQFNKKNQNILVFTENFRQKSDPHFIELLSRVRHGTHTIDDITLLKSRLKIQIKGTPVHLVSSNKSAQIINESNLDKIKEPGVIFKANYIGKNGNTELVELLKKELGFQFKQKGIDILELKKGTRVMLIKNLDVSIGLVNGSLGTIESIKNYPTVKFDNGEKLVITPVTWELELDNTFVTATQIPLMLAYAITIHRSQSLSLDSAILDLSDCFADAQVYVALSRVRSLDGLYINSFNPSKIKVNAIMKEYMDNLNYP